MQKINPSQIVKRILEQNKEYVISLITQEQIYKKGIKGDGSKITPAYSKAYQRTKERKGLYQGYVDLSLTGTYLKQWIAEFNELDFEVYGVRESNGFDVAQGLKNRYTDGIEDFTKESLDAINELLIKNIPDEIRKELQNI